jgi:hypothetical protein
LAGVGVLGVILRLRQRMTTGCTSSQHRSSLHSARSTAHSAIYASFHASLLYVQPHLFVSACTRLGKLALFFRLRRNTDMEVINRDHST